MHCDGKCFLRKELKNYYTANSSNPEHTPGKENIHIVSFWIDMSGFQDSDYQTNPLLLRWHHKMYNYNFTFFSDVFHPPAA